MILTRSLILLSVFALASVQYTMEYGRSADKRLLNSSTYRPRQWRRHQPLANYKRCNSVLSQPFRSRPQQSSKRSNNIRQYKKHNDFWNRVWRRLKLPYYITPVQRFFRKSRKPWLYKDDEYTDRSTFVDIPRENKKQNKLVLNVCKDFGSLCGGDSDCCHHICIERVCLMKL